MAFDIKNINQPEIERQTTIGPFNVRVLSHHGEYSVLYSANGTRLEGYDCNNFDDAMQDYNTICVAIRHVLAVIKQSLG